MRPLDAFVFRSNPAYEVVVRDRLPEAARALVPEGDGETYGVLWPNREGLPPHALTHDTALLVYTLQQPGPLPAYVGHEATERRQAIAALVLDGVLEVAAHADGPFLSGAAAHGLLYAPAVQPADAATGRVATLSRSALRYAQALPLMNAARLSVRLYRYNTRPLTPRWRRLMTPAATRAFLGMNGRASRRMEQAWASTSSGPDAAWWTFRSRRMAASGQHLGFKLYVSPAPEALPEVMPAITDALAAAPVVSFKVGRRVEHLLRPDKLVAYCARFEDLAETAERLREHLAGCPAHGVPFTASIDAEGLLSWGMDPENTEAIATRESWRLWVTNRLAESLLAAREASSSGSDEAAGVEPWQFALERLRLHGVDTDRWTPSQGIWS